VNEFKGQNRAPRGGPEWYNAASCVFYARRGEPGQPREEAVRTNLLRLGNSKQRYAAEGIMPEARLVMNLDTRRLYEEAEFEGLQYVEIAEEGNHEWPNN